jgi:hypothetical protein
MASNVYRSELRAIKQRGDDALKIKKLEAEMELARVSTLGFRI